MTTKIEELKIKRDQLNARIQKAETKAKQTEKKQADRIKVLVGAAIVDSIKNGQIITIQGPDDLLKMMSSFLSRQTERDVVMGKDGSGSEMLHSLTKG